MSMNVFDSVDGAVPSQGGSYLNGGHRYLLEVGLTKAQQSQTKVGTINYIVEFRVHESSDPAYTPGSKASWIANMSNRSSPGDVRWFVGCARGIGPSDPRFAEITGALVTFTTAGANPLGPNAGAGRPHGAMIEVETVSKAIQSKPGSFFTKHNWKVATRGPVLPPDASIAISQAPQQQQGYGGPPQQAQAPQYGAPPQHQQMPPVAASGWPSQNPGQYAAPQAAPPQQATQWGPQAPQQAAPQTQWGPQPGAPQQPPAYPTPPQAAPAQQTQWGPPNPALQGGPPPGWAPQQQPAPQAAPQQWGPPAQQAAPPGYGPPPPANGGYQMPPGYEAHTDPRFAATHIWNRTTNDVRPR